jgi:hypothetical protein
MPTAGWPASPERRRRGRLAGADQLAVVGAVDEQPLGVGDHEGVVAHGRLAALGHGHLGPHPVALHRHQEGAAQALQQRHPAGEGAGALGGGELGVLGADPDHHLVAVGEVWPGVGRHGQAGAPDPQPAVVHGRLQQVHRGRADEAGHEQVGRAPEHLHRRAQLPDPPGVHHGHAVGQGQGLGLVVGDVHGGGAQLVLEALEEAAGLQPQPRVQVGQRLVEQEHLRPVGDRPGQGDPLLLAARQLAGAALHGRLQLEAGPGLGGGAVPLGLGHPLDLERVGDVVQHRHVRVQGVVLEHHGHLPPARLDPGHVAPADLDGARGRGLQPGDGPQQGGLAAARRAEQGEELPVLDAQVEAVDRPHPSGELLDQRAEHDLGHQRLIPP